MSKDSIFVDEDDIFEISVSYYIEDGELIVEDDNKFKKDKDSVKALKMTLSYPDLGTTRALAGAGINIVSGDVSYTQLKEAQILRMIVLAKSWSEKSECNDESISKLKQKIVDVILEKISNEIGMQAIL